MNIIKALLLTTFLAAPLAAAPPQYHLDVAAHHGRMNDVVVCSVTVSDATTKSVVFAPRIHVRAGESANASATIGGVQWRATVRPDAAGEQATVSIAGTAADGTIVANATGTVAVEAAE